ncbi:hypothetical protein [Pedobacter caeni]|uniref:Uncharacterized protein n=1 Tax=Pedobacter caeni TaxID=288992 RepID=A0A1M5F5N1_9SPHI|nr:hypothetical protein [Pedobacter caeni]SHF86827.1 hypothetical protein SAMN04488522_103946 [Pedobacter caeni]
MDILFDNVIAFRPQPKIGRSYGISIKYFDDLSSEVVKRLDYQIHLFVQQYKNLDNTWQLSFDKDELFINQHEPDLVSEQLAHLAMKALFPVKVDVNSKNEVFRGIANHEDILKRWEETVLKMNDKYEGDLVELFIEKMSEKIGNKHELLHALANDMFWQTFFHPQYFRYEQNLSKEMVFEFPVLPYQLIRFKGKQSLSDGYSSLGTYKVGFTGEAEIPAGTPYEGRGNGKAKMKLEAKFDLDQNGGLLKYAVINWGIEQQDGEHISRSNRVQFSAYEIATENKINKEENGVERADEPKVSSAKKGFWERMLG